MPGKFDIAVKDLPDAPVASDLMVIVLASTMGALYTMPDVLPEHLQELIYQLDRVREGAASMDSTLVLRNLSGVVLTVPVQILLKVGQAVDGDINRFREIWSA